MTINNKRPTRRVPKSKGQEEIWSEDVETALHEILAMAPKQGSHRVKICNRSVGRNDIISTYILAKTGKYRRRKQISSHIQVLKNHGTNKALIELIKNGPTFETVEEDEANRNKFIATFESICKQKGQLFEYLPFNGDNLLNSSDLASTLEPDLDVHLSQLVFFINSAKYGTLCLTSQVKVLPPHHPAPSLTYQFPAVERHFQYKAPILRNTVRIFPNLYDLGAVMHTRCRVDVTGYNGPLNCFTTVMSMGQEVLRTNEKDFPVNQSSPFLKNFWNSLFQTCDQLIAPTILTFQGITVKQILYKPIDEDSYDLLLSNVKAVLLWDFGIVNRAEDAVTISSKVLVPASFTQDPLVARQPGPFYPCMRKSSEVIQIGLSASSNGLDSVAPVETSVNSSFNYSTQMVEPLDFSQNPYNGYFGSHIEGAFRGDTDFMARPQQ